jgi:hypothetical protein
MSSHTKTTARERNLARFQRHITRNVAVSATLIAAALGLGTVGYHLTEGIPWIDAFLCASMILTGMGPTSPLDTVGGKLFASFYALFSGVFFLSMVALILAPILHRMLHTLHIAMEEEEG